MEYRENSTSLHSYSDVGCRDRRVVMGLCVPCLTAESLSASCLNASALLFRPRTIPHYASCPGSYGLLNYLHICKVRVTEFEPCTAPRTIETNKRKQRTKREIMIVSCRRHRPKSDNLQPPGVTAISISICKLPCCPDGDDLRLTLSAIYVYDSSALSSMQLPRRRF